MVGVITICFVTRFFSLERSWNCYRNVIDRWWFSGNLERSGEKVGRSLENMESWRKRSRVWRNVIELIPSNSVRGRGETEEGERKIGNEFSLLIVVTFKIHGIQFSKLSYSGFFFFCSWSTRLPRWNWLKAGKNLLCGRGWWNLRDARPECEWSDKRPLLNSFFHFKRISKFLLPSQRLRDSCYFNAFLQLAVRHGGKWNYFSCYPRCLYCNQLYEYSFFWVVLVLEFGKPELQNPP